MFMLLFTYIVLPHEFSETQSNQYIALIYSFLIILVSKNVYLVVRVFEPLEGYLKIITSYFADIEV